MRDLLSDDTCPSKSFCGLPKMRNNLRKAGLEQKVYKKQAGQRQRSECFLSPFVSLCLLLHFLSLFTFLLENKGNALNDQRPSIKRPASRYSFFFPQNLRITPWKTSSCVTPQLLLFFSRWSNTQEPDEWLRQ